MFQKGGRNDLVEKEEAELKVLQRFLPEPLTDEEIKPAIPTAIRESGAAGLQDSWEGIERVMPKISDRPTAKKSMNRREKYFLAPN